MLANRPSHNYLLSTQGTENITLAAVRTDSPSSRLENLRATLLAPPFILALVVLIANDFWFKRAWPGFVTGKLSDFAGVAIVAWMLLALTPGRRWIAYVTVSLAFSWWKSGLSQPFIDAVNALSPWPIARVVDFTDLMALSVLAICRPVSPRSRNLPAYRNPRRWMLPPLAVLTSLALMATSMPITQEVFQIRQQRPDAALDPKAIFASVSTIASQHGLECQDCGAPSKGATFAGKAMELKYTLVAPDTMRFSVYAGPSGFPFGKSAWERTDPLIGDLKRQLPRTHRGLVLTQELDPDRARQ
jgi:hypothetical protein